MPDALSIQVVVLPCVGADVLLWHMTAAITAASLIANVKCIMASS